MKRIDLNVDIGEGYPNDDRLLDFATSANICCGEHAGSWELTQETIHRCMERDVRIGMHPGYPDRNNMGRHSMRESQLREFADSVADQVERFFLFVPAAYIKPHGALYNDAVLGLKEARDMIADACRRLKIPLMGLPNSALQFVARAEKVAFIREGFADRAYRPDGTLVPRTQIGAVLEKPKDVKRQVLEVAPKVNSICLHGDTKNCVEFAELVFKTLVDAGYEVGA